MVILCFSKTLHQYLLWSNSTAAGGRCKAVSIINYLWGFFFTLSICVSISIFAVRSTPHRHHLTALLKGAQAHTHWWCMCICTIPSSVWQKLTHTYSKKAPSVFLPLSVFSLQTYTTQTHSARMGLVILLPPQSRFYIFGQFALSQV